MTTQLSTFSTQSPGPPSRFPLPRCVMTSTRRTYCGDDVVQCLNYREPKQRLHAAVWRGTNRVAIKQRCNVGCSKCCFTTTETVGLLGTGAQDVHLDFHTIPEFWYIHTWWHRFIVSSEAGLYKSLHWTGPRRNLRAISSIRVTDRIFIAYD